MERGPRGSRVREPGQAAVEFALAAPLLFFLFFMLIEAARFGVSLVMVGSVARQAAHAGAFASVTTDAPLVAAGNQVTNLLGTLPASAFTITPAGTDNGGPGRSVGGTVRVAATYQFPVHPLFTTFLGNGVAMSAAAQMPVE